MDSFFFLMKTVFFGQDSIETKSEGQKPELLFILEMIFLYRLLILIRHGLLCQRYIPQLMSQQFFGKTKSNLFHFSSTTQPPQRLPVCPQVS